MSPRRRHGSQVIVGGLKTIDAEAGATLSPRDDRLDAIAKLTYLNAEDCRIYLRKKSVRAVYEWARRNGVRRCGGRGEWLVLRRDVDERIQQGREAWHAREGNASSAA